MAVDNEANSCAVLVQLLVISRYYFNNAYNSTVLSVNFKEDENFVYLLALFPVASRSKTIVFAFIIIQRGIRPRLFEGSSDIPALLAAQQNGG